MRIRTNSFSHNLTLEVKIAMKISAFQWKNWKIEMKNIKLKMKNCKTFCKPQTASRLKEVIQQIKLTTSLEPRFLWEICRNIQTFAFKVLCSANVFFWHQPDICYKICKVRKVFGCVLGACIFQCRVSWGL